MFWLSLLVTKCWLGGKQSVRAGTCGPQRGEGSGAGPSLCTLTLLVALVQGGRLSLSFGVFLAKFLTLRRQTGRFSCGAVSAVSVAVDILRRAEEKEEEEALSDHGRSRGNVAQAEHTGWYF